MDNARTDERAKQLLEIARSRGAEDKAAELVEDLAFLEKRLAELRRLPHLRIDPDNPERQKSTPAAKQYKDMLAQYNNSMKLFLKICGDLSEEEVESPLRAWAKMRKDYDLDTGQ